MGHVMAHAVVTRLLMQGPRLGCRKFMWDFWWTKRHWDRFIFEQFRFPLSVSFHQCSRFIFYHPWCIITANEGVVKKTLETTYESAPLKKTKSYIRLLGQVSIQFNGYNLNRGNTVVFRKLNTYIMQSTQFFYY